MELEKVQVSEMSIEANGRIIYGKLYRSVDESRCPAIIFSHGYNGSNSNFECECRYFASRGYVTYAYDFCGGSVGSKSSGATTDMTVFSEKEDLLAVIMRVRMLDCVDEKNIYLVGASQGGLVTTLAAEEAQKLIRGMILYFPALCIPNDWRKRFRTEEEIPEVVKWWGMDLGRNFFMAIREYDVFENIGKFCGDVLIIQGDKDSIVLAADSEKARKLYKNAKLVVLPGEGHGFSPRGTQKAMELMDRFFAQNRAIYKISL